MPSRRLTKKTIKGKDGVHPGSRKAGQLVRVALRTEKLKLHTRLRRGASSTKLERPLFFLYSLSSPSPLSMASLHALVEQVFLARHDERIAELTAERRAGRPKQKELLELEELRRREEAEYESGLEIPDLTHAPTVRFLYSLLTSETNFTASHLDLLRHVRIVKGSDELIETRKGQTDKMGLSRAGQVEGGGDDWTELQKSKGAETEGMEVESAAR